MDIEIDRDGNVTRYNNVTPKIECGLYVFRNGRNDAICLLDGGKKNRDAFKAGKKVYLNASVILRKVE
jgi:hypothetical protein